jgi:hypothetical protein
MSIGPLFLLIPLLGILFYAFYLLDRLIRTEYEQYRSAWEADGKPCFFAQFDECNFWSSFVGKRIALVWLFRTPDWIRKSPDLMRILKRFRYAVLIWNVGILIWVATVWLSCLLTD